MEDGGQRSLLCSGRNLATLSSVPTSKIRNIPSGLNNLGQESANSFCKGPDSNYFMFEELLDSAIIARRHESTKLANRHQCVPIIL